jgi:hypothetical protein
MAFPLSLPPRDLLRGRLVLIYQMPKIGSQSIEATLQHCQFTAPIRRFHYLSPALAGTIRRGVSSRRPDPAWKREAQQQLDSVREISRTIQIRRLLCALGFKLPKIEVITAVRDLIGLVLSSIFENYLYFAPTLESMTVERCREALLHPKTFQALRNWFDLELKRFIGLDVFAVPFPYAQGYLLLENRFARVLLYRFEALGQLAGLLQSFLHHPIPALVNANLGSAKPYAARYSHARQNLRLPAGFVSSLYSDKMMRHFYSESERRDLLAKWVEPEPQPSESQCS